MTAEPILTHPHICALKRFNETDDAGVLLEIKREFPSFERLVAYKLTKINSPVAQIIEGDGFWNKCLYFAAVEYDNPDVFWRVCNFDKMGYVKYDKPRICEDRERLRQHLSNLHPTRRNYCGAIAYFPEMCDVTNSAILQQFLRAKQFEVVKACADYKKYIFEPSLIRAFAYHADCDILDWILAQGEFEFPEIVLTYIYSREYLRATLNWMRENKLMHKASIEMWESSTSCDTDILHEFGIDAPYPLIIQKFLDLTKSMRVEEAVIQIFYANPCVYTYEAIFDAVHKMGYNLDLDEVCDGVDSQYCDTWFEIVLFAGPYFKLKHINKVNYLSSDNKRDLRELYPELEPIEENYPLDIERLSLQDVDAYLARF